ncbi:glycosyltransferase family 4 protein [Mycetocola sp. 2940]|uniref:glycosyltransferase family 4 protein n=1 Tax=Mycetocola sp. 2940 TaxID=3156452 RepID=UPI0033963792
MTTDVARSRVLILTPDVISRQMAGPAIRAFEMARALDSTADVRLVSTQRTEPIGAPFPVHHASDSELREHADWADVVIFQGHILDSHPWLTDPRYVLVADIYDPMHLEVLEQAKAEKFEDRVWISAHTAEVLNVQIERADYMLCASEKQRDFWLGQLAAMNRINPLTYDDDVSLRTLLDVVPFGLPDERPVQRVHGIKGAVPGIRESDKVILWGGGLYNWFDPLTLLRAVAGLSEEHSDLRLFFLGGKHPNANVPAMRMAAEARSLADELGLLGSVVFFHEEWVPYESRADFLLDADVGVSTHFNHLETAFSFRTRILDYLWAGLPIVSTTGDTFAGLVEREGLGLVVPPEDVDALQRALVQVLYDDDSRMLMTERVARTAAAMTWTSVLQPLVAFCTSPRKAPDNAHGVVSVRTRQRLDLEKRIDGIERSTSWKVTAPLRAVVTALNRRRR